ncbi:XkdQ/YqbQ family protein [Enterococcus casseliflavus]|uniref:XkdQ/YqbQ family protein n=1 Tax=Enterococcus casseliflavus TaxID=37734 RepID=UPI0023D8C767|nr:hypothetical protein [Enterococcus casseliflavus]WEI91863.1 hypothetical protein PZY29_14195 [Enterococcus casseliflavus]
MNLQILETSMVNRQMYDISEIVSDPRWTTGIASQPGKLEFTILDDRSVYLRSGDIIEAKADGKTFFKGKVFIRKKQHAKLWQIVAYDNLRYLKNEDTIVFGASSISARFKRICETQGMPYRILDHVPYNCPAAVMDNKTYFSMLEDSLADTRLNYGGMRYSIRDNAGTLEFATFNRLITKLVLGDASLLTDYSYEATIDQAANAVKVIREDSEKNTREIYTASHGGNIEKWGRLQIVETVSEADLNASQLQQQANALLRAKNEEVKKINVSAIGSMEISAGNSFILRLKELEREGIGNDNLALVTSCTHHLGKTHTMNLEVEVVA